MRNKKQKGFTLIELLVVIAIIGLLASVVLVALNGAREKSREAKRLADMTQMAAAFELFYNDAQAYPTGTNYVSTNTAILGTGGGLQAYNATSGQLYTLTPTYLSLIPTYPTPLDSPNGGSCAGVAAVTSVPTSSGPGNYIYQTDMKGDTYTLSFCLGASGSGSYAGGGHYLTPKGVQ